MLSMILFARSNANQFFAIESTTTIHPEVHEKLEWLLNATILPETTLTGLFVGPRKEMLTPWCTNAIEIMENMGIDTINRIEELTLVNDALVPRDKMLQVIFENPGQDIFFIAATPTPIIEVEDIASFNQKEGLALSDEEINYLNSVSQKLDRKLTDSEVFGFSQVNSEHCRHKIFNGIFVIDGVEKETSLFKLIKKTTETHPNTVVSAYKDNVAFIQGPIIEQFAPSFQETSSEFETKQIE